MRAFKPVAVLGLAAWMVLGVIPAASAATVTATVDNVVYTADDADQAAGATVTNFTGGAGATVTIPSSVTIGGTVYAVTAIGSYAFYDNALTSVTIPEGVTSISNHAFWENALTSVTIPEGVTSIGNYAFATNNLASVTIPGSVTSIGNQAFNDNALTSVTIPDGVTSIGNYAFWQNALTSVTISGTVTSIGSHAFWENALTSVTIPDGVTSIGNYAFDGNALTSVTISDSVTSIGSHAFEGNALTAVTIPDGVTSIGDYAFAENNLASVAISDSLTSIGNFAFRRNALTAVTIPNGVTSIGNYAFAENDLASVTIPDGVTTIGSRTFADNNLTSVTIPDSVTTISSEAFADNPALSDLLFLGAAPTTIGFDFLGVGDPLVSFYWAFGDAQTAGGFTTPTWESYGSQAIAVVDFDLNGYGAAVASEDVVVGERLAAPAEPTESGQTFTGWFTAVTGGAQWDFGTMAVAGDMTLFAHWGPPAPVTSTIGDVEYTVDSTDQAAGATVTNFTGGTGATVTIPNSVTIGGTVYAVTAIGSDAFRSDALASVTIPDGVTSIGDYAFHENALTSVAIPDGVTFIGTSAFSRNALTSLTIPGSVTSIEPCAFCENALSSVTIPDGVTSIGTYAFASNALTSVAIPDSVVAIGFLSFGDNPALSGVRFLGAVPTALGFNFLGSSDPLVSFYWALGEPQTAGGFTTPTWQSYDSQAIAVIDFELNGYGAAVASEEVVVGERLAAPEEPTESGRTFTGWFTAASGGAQWDFGTMAVAGDMTLFAHWAPAAPAGGGAEGAVPAEEGEAEPALAATGAEAGPALTTGALAVVCGLLLVAAGRRKARTR